MEISEKLQKYKVQILVTLGLCVVVSTLVLVVAPRLVTILSYFWPLFLSTALFLVSIVVFAKTAAVSTDARAYKSGEGLLDYVSGDHPHHHQINHRDNHDDEHKVES